MQLNVTSLFKSRTNYDSQKIALTIVCLMIILYSIFSSLLTCAHHDNFHTHAWDLGSIVQIYWSIIHHGNMLSGIENGTHYVGQINHLSNHFSPCHYLLALFFWISPHAKTLLTLQSFLLGLGALPVYLICKNKTDNIALSLALSLSYLLYAPLHYTNNFDYHEIALAVPLILFSFYFLEIKKNFWFCLFLFLAFMVKEDISLSGFAIGLYVFFNKNQKKLGLAIAIFSLVYFVTVTQVIMPSLVTFKFDDYSKLIYSDLNSPKHPGYLGIIYTVLTKPIFIFRYIFFNQEKLLYLVKMTYPVLFLPLYNNFSALALLFPSFLVNLLANGTGYCTIIWHHNAHIIPYIFFTTILALQRIINNKLRTLIAFLLILSGMISFYTFLHNHQMSRIGDLFHKTEHSKLLDSLVKKIPSNASVSASFDIVPHIANRETSFVFPTINAPNSDFIILDLSDDANHTPLGTEVTLKELKKILASKTYKIIYYNERKGVLLKKI